MHFIGGKALTLTDCSGKVVHTSYEMVLTVLSLIAACVCTSMATHQVLPEPRDGEEVSADGRVVKKKPKEPMKVAEGNFKSVFLSKNNIKRGAFEQENQKRRFTVCGRTLYIYKFPVSRLCTSSAFLSVAALVMHYMGQLAQHGPYSVVYSPKFVLLSVVVSPVVTTAGLFIMVQVSSIEDAQHEYNARLIAALVVAGAVNVIHYVGMLGIVYRSRYSRDEALTAHFGTPYITLRAETLAIISISVNTALLSAAQQYSNLLFVALKREHEEAMKFIPDNVQEVIESIHEDLKNKDSGHVATYIPELANAEPDKFGIAVCDIEGQIYAVGDVDHYATIQSVCKTILYVMAMSDNGRSAVDRKVGEEPSGSAFNKLAIDDQNRAFNPLINTGAIVTSSLIKGQTADQRYERYQNFVRQMVYGPSRVKLNTAVYESEMATNDNNRAILDALVSNGIVDAKQSDVALDFYTRACSLDACCVDLAVLAATMAFNGTNPVTNQAIIPSRLVNKLVTVTITCGMHNSAYNGAGKWMVDVGVPAKSGVSGFIIGLVPGACGFAVFSPRLDENGNPHRGVLVAEALSNRLGLHVLKGKNDASTASVDRGSCAEVLRSASTIVNGRPGSLRSINAKHKVTPADAAANFAKGTI